MINKKKFSLFALSLTFLLYWITLWFSINTSPYEVLNFSLNLKYSINYLRFILPFLFSLLIIIFLLYILLKNRFKIKTLHLIFFLYFFSQLIGLYLNDQRDFNINNYFLSIFAIGTICLFVLFDYYKIDYLYKYIFSLSLLALFLGFNMSFWTELNNINNLNFYDAFSEKSLNILQQPRIRITGLSRILAIINLFIFLYFSHFKNLYHKKILIFVSIISILLLFMNSRGTLICYNAALIYIIFFVKSSEKNNKIKNIIIFIIVPIFIYFSLSTYLNETIKEKKETTSYSRILSTNTSGRTYLWTYTLSNYEYKKIFGYGPRGDSFFLKNSEGKELYGDNVSNIFMYSLLSGGTISSFFLILIFSNIFKIIKKFTLSQNYSKSLFLEIFSVTCLIFFSIRSIFENSFGVFGIDFLLTYLAISYLIKSKKN